MTRLYGWLVCLTTFQSLLDTVVAIGMMISPPIGGALYEVRQRPLYDVIELRHSSYSLIPIPDPVMFVTLKFVCLYNNMQFD